MASNTSTRRSQRERTAATTGALVAAARELFIEDGFSATSLDEICARAKVTRGAFYHHFDNKEHIFRLPSVRHGRMTWRKQSGTGWQPHSCPRASVGWARGSSACEGIRP